MRPSTLNGTGSPSLGERSRSEMVWVTPALAQATLTDAAYDRQRPLRKNHVHRLATAITRGELTPDNVILYTLDGARYLVDGQHRLAAIVQADTAVWLPVMHVEAASRDEVDIAYSRLGRGMIRGFRDAYLALGLGEELELSHTEVNKVGQAIAHYITGFTVQTDTARALTSLTDVRANYIRAWAPSAREYFAITAGTTHAWAKVLHTSVPMAVALITLAWKPAPAANFWTAVAHGECLVRNDPEHTLRLWLQTHQLRFTGVPTYARAIAGAWNARAERRSLSVLRPDSKAPLRIQGTPFRGKAVDPAALLHPGGGRMTVDTALDLAYLAQRALTLPDVYAAAEQGVLAAHHRLVEAKRRLAEAEMVAYLDDQVVGKNAEAREAMLRSLTDGERLEWERNDGRYREAVAQRDVLLEEMRMVRAVLTALGGRP